MQRTTSYKNLQFHPTLRRAALFVCILFCISPLVFSQELGRSYTKEIGIGVSQMVSNNGILRNPIGLSIVMRRYKPHSPWVPQIAYEYHYDVRMKTSALMVYAPDTVALQEQVETSVDFGTMKIQQFYFFPLQKRVLEVGVGAGVMLGLVGKKRRGLESGRVEESLPVMKAGYGGSFCVRYTPSVSEPIAYHAIAQLDYLGGLKSASSEHSIQSRITVFTIQVGVSYSY